MAEKVWQLVNESGILKRGMVFQITIFHSKRLSSSQVR